MPDPTPVDIRADGLLWLINRTVFNPRGFALTFDGSMFALVGDGSRWYPPGAAGEQDLFAAVEAILARTKREQSGLAGHIEATNPPIVDPIPEDPPPVVVVEPPPALTVIDGPVQLDPDTGKLVPAPPIVSDE